MSGEPRLLEDSIGGALPAGGDRRTAERDALIAKYRKVQVPVSGEIDALTPSVADTWVAFAAATYRKPWVGSGQIAKMVGLSRGHVNRLLHRLEGLGLVCLKGKRWHRVWMLRDLSGYGDDGNWIDGKFERYSWRNVEGIEPRGRAWRRGAQLLANIIAARKLRGNNPIPRALLQRWCGCSLATINRALDLLESEKRITREATRQGLILTVLDTT